MNITKLTNKKGEIYYRIRVSDGYTEDGKQKIYSTNWKPNPRYSEQKNEGLLQKFAARFEIECKEKKTVQKTEKKLFNEVAEEWFRFIKKEDNLKSGTITRYENCKTRIYEYFKDRDIKTILQQDIKDFIAEIGQTPPTPSAHSKNKTLSRKTQSLYVTVLSNIFKFAYDKKYIDANPCHDINLKKEEVKETKIMTAEEMKAILEALENEPILYKTFFYMAAFTGCRRGELLGLEWKDFNFTEKYFRVRRNSIKGEKGQGPATGTLKSKTSNRKIYIEDNIIELLKLLKEEQESNKKIAGKSWVNSDRLFTYPDGSPLVLDAPRKWLNRFCKRHNLPKYNVHSFRHYFGSLLIMNNVDIVTVSKLLGHGQITTTMNTYLHELDSDVARNAIKIISQNVSA